MSRSSSTNGRRRDDLAEFWFEKVAFETKTIEEIREHTISEDLTPISRATAMLESKNDLQRLVGLRSIPSLMISDRSETVRRLLPKFKNIVEHSVDSEEHVVAAETILMMIETETLSFNDFLNQFSTMICPLIFPKTTNRFSTDFGSIWCQTLCKIIDKFTETSQNATLLDLFFQYSLHGSYVRDRLAVLLAVLAPRLPSSIIETRVLPVFKNFINDTNADIRALACQKLPFLLQSSNISKTIFAFFVVLSKDENLLVRQNCFESLLDVAERFVDSESTENLIEMIVSLVKFGLSSKTSSFFSVIAARLSDLCRILSRKKSFLQFDEFQFIHELFVRLVDEKNYSDCRISCAKNFSSIIDFLGYEELGNEFEEYFYRLCRDGDAKIRSTMPLTIIDLGNFENQRDTTFNSILFNGFLTLLNDNNVDVMFSVAKNLLKIFQIFSRDPTDGLLNGSISSEASISDSETFLTRILDFERRIFETTLSWRSCIFCLQAFVHLPFLLANDQIHNKILPRVYSRIFSKQICVREVAVDSYLQLLRRVLRRNVRKNAFLKLKGDLLYNKSYQWRLMYVKVCRRALVHYSKKFFKENFLETILSIDFDSVSSVRIQMVPLLIEIKSILRLPADQQAIQKLENMMKCFLGDKTMTLHDLANNGLLQLDQIRSYHPASISTNDHDDQRKENDENFLDELDSTSRRPTSKSNDQTSLTKRLNETSISTKSSSLKSPRTSKSFSDERQRKSSFSLETKSTTSSTPSIKTRRRQTLTGSASTSSTSVRSSAKKVPNK